MMSQNKLIKNALRFTLVLSFLFITTLFFRFEVNAIGTYNLRVLTIGINPEEGGENLVQKYFNRNAAATESDTFNTAINAFKDLSGNNINYTIVSHLNINQFPLLPDGSPVFNMASYAKCVQAPTDLAFCDSRKYAFSYQKFVEDFNICTIARQNNVDEIWMVTPPYIGKWESLFIGPYMGYWINGVNEVSSTCDKLYPIMGPTYDAPQNLLHNFGHRFESNIEYILSNIPDSEKNNHWRRFSGFGGQSLGCGNTHRPTNFRSEYDYSNTIVQTFTCPDWENFPNYTGATVNIGCATWGCSDPTWQEYWLGFVPSNSGTTQLRNNSNQPFNIARDWWSYLLNPTESINFVNYSANPPPEVTTCSSFTYSDWDSCANGQQSRVVSSASPANCTGGSPLLTQTCQEVCSEFEYSEWGSCLNGSETRTLLNSTPANCSGGNPILTRACGASQSCYTYTYSDWSECLNEKQSRGVMTQTEIDCAINDAQQEPLERSCVLECTGFEFSRWSICENGKQSREVMSKSPIKCQTDIPKELLSRDCLSNEDSCQSVKYSWGECINGIQEYKLQSKFPENCIENFDRAITRVCEDSSSQFNKVPTSELRNSIITQIGILSIFSIATLSAIIFVTLKKLRVRSL